MANLNGRADVKSQSEVPAEHMCVFVARGAGSWRRDPRPIIVCVRRSRGGPVTCFA
jgi:hypothetical protein